MLIHIFGWKTTLLVQTERRSILNMKGVDYEDETTFGERPELVYDGAFSSEEYDVFKDEEELICGLENPETCESCE